MQTIIPIIIFALFPLFVVADIHSDIKRACTVYCEGDILNQIQMSGIFNDSKTFVDMPMRFDPEVIWVNFNQMTEINKETLKIFLEDNFLDAGSDSEKWIPTDYSKSPFFLGGITDAPIRKWASDLNDLWLLLGKKISIDVSLYPQRHSYLPRRFVFYLLHCNI
jgi:alpha,alpha-trehalase